MADLHFASNLSAALKGKSHIALFASKQALGKGVWKQVFPKAQHDLLGAMLSDAADPGPLGKVVTSFTAARAPRQVAVAVLPDKPSRHLAPARSDAAGECAARLGLGGDARAALVLCLDDPEHYLPLANAIARAFPTYANRGGSKPPKRPDLTVVAIDARGRALRAPAETVHTVTNSRWVADLVDRPTAELSTADFVSEARRGLRGLRGVKVSALVGDQLVRRKLGGLHAVGRAARVAPRLLVLEHRGRGKRRSRKTVALVGKGIVYDTGGLNLKVGGIMSGMKGDMGGGAAVLGAFKTLVQAGYAHRLVCLVPLAENAIGPDSYRPDDILRMHSGKTVEINNTDAEGRLLLADGVSYAARVMGADVIIDAATLTGAQLVSTGRRHAAVVSNRAGLEQHAVEAGLRSGDLTHPLPFAPEVFQAEFKSAVADMRNSVKDRANAQSSCAAQFVYSHIQELNVPWLHIDLAGPAFPGKRATGYGVALIADLVQRLQASHLRA